MAGAADDEARTPDGAALGRELARVAAILLDECRRCGEARGAALAHALAAEHTGPAAIDAGGLERTAACFRLTAFERAALVIAVAVELDDRYAAILGALRGGVARARPTVGQLARWLAPVAATSVPVGMAALGPEGHLWRVGLVDLVGDGPRATREVRVAEPFWPRLVGLDREPALDVVAARPGALDRLVLARATRAAAAAAIAWCRQRRPHECLIAVDGRDGSGREALATAIAAELDHAAIGVDGAALAAPDALRGLVREAAWHHAAVVVRGPVAPAVLAHAHRELTTPVLALVDSAVLRELAAEASIVGVAVAVEPLEPLERHALWAQLFGDVRLAAEVDLAGLATHLRFGPGRICAIAALANAARVAHGRDTVAVEDIAAATRVDAAPGSSAVRVECPYEAGDLVLAPSTRRELALIRAWGRHGATVFGPSAGASRMLGRAGMVAVFAGPPGTGKTMAAQVLARELGRDLLRVDLSQVVNKYIGETEKNLDRVFAEAEAGGALVFFDEADALFGKRTQITDAHDRYANIETAFLLQRLERHPGMVILATNLLANLDGAFVRRIQLIVEFPMPGPGERAAIWRRHLAAEALAPDVDLDALGAGFAITGGDIRNAATTALLLAAVDGTPVRARDLAIAIWRELKKAGRLVAPEAFGASGDDVVAYAAGA